MSLKRIVKRKATWRGKENREMAACWPGFFPGPCKPESGQAYVGWASELCLVFPMVRAAAGPVLDICSPLELFSVTSAFLGVQGPLLGTGSFAVWLTCWRGGTDAWLTSASGLADSPATEGASVFPYTHVVWTQLLPPVFFQLFSVGPSSLHSCFRGHSPTLK